MLRKTGIEKTPLLGPGHHVMTMADLRDITVTRFADSRLRKELFTKLERLVGELCELKIPCDLWIDGSYLTDEDEPWDIDIAVRVMDDVMASLMPQQEDFLTRLSADDCRYIDGLDTFVFAGYWIGHQHYRTEVDEGFCTTLLSWGWQFGLGRDDWLKGMVVVPILETDLGLRLRS